MFSVCVLLYGDYPGLAARCLRSIRLSGGQDCVSDIRIGLHDISAASRRIVGNELDALAEGWPCKIIIYEPIGNTCKYPTFRRMVHDEDDPVSEHVMWFDDDSYICAPDFWLRLDEALWGADMLGQLCCLPVQGTQWEWICTQPWYRGLPRPQKFTFCPGGWWVIKSSVLRHLNWPVPELKHCGGDSLLGEALRQNRYRITRYDYGVRINADSWGRHAQAPRRGLSERVLGYDYAGKPYSTSHQNFRMCKSCWNATISSITPSPGSWPETAPQLKNVAAR